MCEDAPCCGCCGQTESFHPDKDFYAEPQDPPFDYDEPDDDTEQYPEDAHLEPDFSE